MRNGKATSTPDYIYDAHCVVHSDLNDNVSLFVAFDCFVFFWSDSERGGSLRLVAVQSIYNVDCRVFANAG